MGGSDQPASLLKTITHSFPVARARAHTHNTHAHMHMHIYAHACTCTHTHNTRTHMHRGVCIPPTVLHVQASDRDGQSRSAQWGSCLGAEPPQPEASPAVDNTN